MFTWIFSYPEDLRLVTDMHVRFGDCVFDEEGRLLSRRGAAVDLTPKAFALLGALIEKRPQAIPKQELKDLLWPRTFVAETSLARVVSDLRRALGAEGRLVRTVHGFGYAFSSEGCAEAPRLPGQPCSLLLGAREIPLAEGENVIGRSLECVARVNSPRVSRRHSRIVVRDGRATIEDLGSKNGTAVGGRRILGVVALEDGDEISIGPVVLTFLGGGVLGSTATGG